MNKKAVIFDMDGVIIDSEPLWQVAQIESLAGFGVAITGQDCEQLTMGKRIALATSSNHVVIQAVFDRLALWDKFSVICSAEDEAHGKPQPDVYLTAARKLKVNVEDCLVIEDSFVGLTAAKKANMTTYLISPYCHQSIFSIADKRYINLASLVHNVRKSVICMVDLIKIVDQI